MLYYILYATKILTPEQATILFLFSILVYFFSLAFHEFIRGFVAYKMGDITPKASGRLTMNPFKHLDLFGFISFLLLGIGWAKPMPINPLNFKKYRKGIRLVSLFGVLSNLMLGLVAAGLYALAAVSFGTTSEIVQYILLLLDSAMIVNSFLAMFHALPIFPYDGFYFISSFMKNENGYIKFNFKYGHRIIWGILIASIFIDLLFGFDILDWFLCVLYNYVFVPISSLGL